MVRGVDAMEGSGGERGEEDEGWSEAFRSQVEAERRQADAEEKDEDEAEFGDLFGEEMEDTEVIIGDDADWELFGPDDDGEGGPAIEGEEGHRARPRRHPTTPSQEEIDEHEMTHIPYRDWCLHCRRCQGRADPHKQKTDTQKAEDKASPVSTWSIDYSYFTTEGIPIPHRDTAAHWRMQETTNLPDGKPGRSKMSKLRDQHKK